MTTIAALIRTHRSEILRAWTEHSKQATSAKDLSSLELASLMPEYLSLLGQETPEPDARLSGAKQALIERHLSNRLREGFNLNEILTEFAVLGRCVSRFLQTEAPGDRPSGAEVASLYAELYQTSTTVTRIFNEHCLEDEQTMKRYARLLERIANEPLGAHDRFAPLHDRLDEVLGLILEAMGAHTAALLLLDGNGHRMAPTAMLGAGAAELERIAQTLEATTFADRSGTTGAEAAEVQTTAALRHDGVHSLVRVGLAAHDARRCALYIGIAEGRAFTASELRRVEGLSSALAIHLDNARLRGDLRDTMNELRVERELRERVVSVLVRELRGLLGSARSSAERLATDPVGVTAQAIDIVDKLGRSERVVDDFLATTPAMDGDRVH
jgi:RsbT co-antagonist protein rsbRD N-terminal domain